ncbi:hypothetical protein PIB30_076613 [Stylosanthes scabra]|uniref:Uncharacterized protein n=1 Tax=Stylosanthes scabra TaxID=79078 RepID=A0ABU6TQQ7_9FABA|nr:hypothetical protein [Stylosanthes scabra]
MEEVEPACTKPPDKPINKNKAHKKKDKEQKGKPEYSNALPHSYQTSKAQNSFLTWLTMKQGHDTEDVMNPYFMMKYVLYLMGTFIILIDRNPTFMNGQGWEPCQVGYHSDGSSDGYFSCEDSLSACQIDNIEFHHQAQFEAMFEVLVQERVEILEVQKRTEVQLLAVAELASSVMRRFAHPASPYQEESLGAITMGSGTQLKGPTDESLYFDP